MSETVPTAPQRSFLQWLREMPRWQQVLLGTAMAAVIVGGVLTLAHGGPEPQPAAAGGQGGHLATLAPSSPAPPAQEPAAKGVFRLGFSFVAGFCVGAFVRSMIKVASIALGFWLVMTFALSHYGLIQVNWEDIGGLWDRFWNNVGDEWGNFSRFVTGSLPSAGLAVAGLAIGLKRH